MVLTEMINLAAEIAEQLLVAKDNESDGLLPKTKLDIIRLAELAATLPDLPEPTPEPEPVPKAEPAPEPEPARDCGEATAELPKPEPPEPEPELPKPQAPAPSEQGLVAAELRRLFSLNDLFLFRRELFQGSQVLFDRALEDVGACSSAPEAREILVNNYALDPKRPEAKEFLAVISGLFEI
ncbi:MAG: hypothetical protein NC391_06305 [Alistipes timonensis]|nr:hypothetical protein [Alistipes timonensis]